MLGKTCRLYLWRRSSKLKREKKYWVKNGGKYQKYLTGQLTDPNNKRTKNLIFRKKIYEVLVQPIYSFRGVLFEFHPKFWNTASIGIPVRSLLFGRQTSKWSWMSWMKITQK